MASRFILKLKQNGISGNLLKIIEDFLSNRYQRVVLNGQSSGWAAVNAGVPQGSILGRLLFLIYINDLSTGLSSNPRLFADDTSLFSVVHDRNTSANELNNDLLKIRSLAYQWKMNFNPDPSKQAQEVIFSRKIKKPNHPELIFNNIPVNQTSYQKHLGMFLDNKLNFGEHLKYITNKVNKSIVLLCKLQMILPRRSLVTIYKSFIRPHLDYGDIIFDQAFNKSFHDNLESIQYNASLAITGAIRGTSKKKPYQELGFESLQQKRWFRKLCTFYKIYKNQSTSYFYNLIYLQTSSRISRSSNNILCFHFKHNFFEIFFPTCNY